MFTGTVTIHGLREMERNAKGRVKRAGNLRWLADAVREYMLNTRIPRMFKYGGRIPGRYGKGMRKWAPNTAWVARAKGFNRPLFGKRNRSGIEKSYRVRVTHRRAAGGIGRLWLKLTNVHKAAAWLEQGVAGGKIIRAKDGKVFRIPISPTAAIYRRSYRRGARKARHITKGFAGDAAWIVQHGARGIVKGRS